MFGPPSLQPRYGCGDWPGGVRSSPGMSASHVIRWTILPPLHRGRSMCPNDVITIALRCPNGGSVHVGVGVDIALQITHSSLFFRSSIDNTIPQMRRRLTIYSYADFASSRRRYYSTVCFFRHAFPIWFASMAACNMTTTHMAGINRPTDVHYQYTYGAIFGAMRCVGGADQMSMMLLFSVSIAAWEASAALFKSRVIRSNVSVVPFSVVPNVW